MLRARSPESIRGFRTADSTRKSKSSPGKRPRRLPGPGPSRVIEELSRVFDTQAIDDPDQIPGRNLDGYARARAPHVGLDPAGVDDHARDAPPFEVHGHRTRRHVERRLRHTIAVRAAALVIAYRSHARRDADDLGAAIEARQQRRRDAERADRVRIERP